MHNVNTRDVYRKEDAGLVCFYPNKTGLVSVIITAVIIIVVAGAVSTTFS